MSYLSQKRFYWLDWFRFLAAFEVVACHARLGVWTHYDQIQAGSKNFLTWIFFASTHLGNEAVVLFFVLSGYLVGGKVLQRTFDRSFDTGAYILDRVTRIYVPFLPALIVSGIIGYAIGARPLSVFEFLGNLVGLQSVCVHSYAGNLPLWSLSYEIWFYVLGGIVAILILGKWLGKTVSLCGIMFIFALFTRLDPERLFCWCLGALGYFLALAEDVPPVVFGGGGVLAFFGLAFGQYLYVYRSSFGNFLSSGRVAELIFSLGLAIIFAFVSKRVPAWKPVLWFEKAGSKLAAFSYTLYLTHYPLVMVWAKFRTDRYTALDFHSLGWFVLEMSSCLAFGFLLYLPFEGQTGRIRSWLKRTVMKGESLEARG